MSAIVWRLRTACLVNNELESVCKKTMVSPFRYRKPEAGVSTVDDYVIPHGQSIVRCTVPVFTPTA
jgi:hypothetical protein